MKIYAHPLERGLAPEWAEEWGQDAYGIWAAFVVEGVAHRMRWIPPGTFCMGSEAGKNEALGHEHPAHWVHISEGFWLGEVPCTERLWEAVTGEEVGEGTDGMLPRCRVSLDRVQGFLEELNDQVPGPSAGLPTEAQWEYACRAGTTGRDYGEGRGLGDLAWFGENSGFERHVVGQKLPNPWGLRDMLGNVWEWCDDGPRPYEEGVYRDPVGSAADKRVVRGGSWFQALNVRAAYRGGLYPEGSDEHLGFRLFRGHGAPAKSRAAEPPQGGDPEPARDARRR